MSSFTTPLDLQADDDGRTFTLTSAFVYIEGDQATGKKIEVPAGFVTDFASVPQIFWNVLPPWGRYGKAAVLHDYLYATALFERSRCDKILLEAMGVLGVSWITRWTIFLAVRAGGWAAWDSHRKGETAAEGKK